MDQKRDQRLLEVVSRCAPGDPLREGLDRILHSGRGALIVLGDGDSVKATCSGGFAIDADFTANRLSELAKMDGAIICDADVERIRRANVHLVPATNIPTEESGIRHRTAERTARQTHAPVIAVSEARRTITLYVDDRKYTLDRSDTILARANQALQTLQRYRMRFDESASTLAGIEVEDLVTLREVTGLLQRAEMMVRIADELEWAIVELGRDGRLVRMQADELLAGITEQRDLVVRDYYVGRGGRRADTAIGRLAELSSSEVVNLTEIAWALGYPSAAEELDTAVTPRGYRMLARIPRIPHGVEESIVKRFGSLPRVMRATLEELDEVEGVGEARARMIQEGLSRLADHLVIERLT